MRLSLTIRNSHRVGTGANWNHKIGWRSEARINPLQKVTSYFLDGSIIHQADFNKLSHNLFWFAHGWVRILARHWISRVHYRESKVNVKCPFLTRRPNPLWWRMETGLTFWQREKSIIWFQYPIWTLRERGKKDSPARNNTNRPRPKRSTYSKKLGLRRERRGKSVRERRSEENCIWCLVNTEDREWNSVALVPFLIDRRYLSGPYTSSSILIRDRLTNNSDMKDLESWKSGLRSLACMHVPVHFRVNFLDHFHPSGSLSAGEQLEITDFLCSGQANLERIHVIENMMVHPHSLNKKWNEMRGRELSKLTANWPNSDIRRKSQFSKHSVFSLVSMRTSALAWGVNNVA